MKGIENLSASPRNIVPIFVLVLLAGLPVMAGMDVLFVDGFEGGDTSVWERSMRCVVFEGFYNPG